MLEDSLARFNVPGKIIQNGSPSSTLLMNGVFGFDIECDADGDTEQHG
jgi:hypothetical protein